LNVYIYGGRINSGGLLGVAGRQGQVYGADAASIQPFGDSWRAANESDSIFYYNSTNPFYQFNPDGAPQKYNCSGITTLATSSCSPLNATSPIVTYCSQWITDSSEYYNNCQCDVTLTGDVGWAQCAIDNYITMCRQYCFGCTIPNLPTSALTTTAYGPGLNATVISLQLQTFTIQANDILGNPRTTGGDSFVVVSNPTQNIAFNVAYSGSGGKYTVRYAASLAGAYTIVITFAGVPINGNPFPITVI